MRVLVTNDDGVHAPGITALARALAEAGYQTVVVAPRHENSGAATAMGPVQYASGVEYDTIELEGLPDVPVYGIEGPPALCVMLARLGGFGDPPDVVVAGVNPGTNTGRSVMHSGTVGAGLTAANFGVSGLAVSIGMAGDGEEQLWETATSRALTAFEWLLAQPPRTVLNLNVPNIPSDEVRGVRVGALAPFGTVRTTIVGSSEGRLQVELLPTDERFDLTTDTGLVQAGYAAITPLVGVRSAEVPDLARTVEAWA